MKVRYHLGHFQVHVGIIEGRKITEYFAVLGKGSSVTCTFLSTVSYNLRVSSAPGANMYSNGAINFTAASVSDIFENSTVLRVSWRVCILNSTSPDDIYS